MDWRLGVNNLLSPDNCTLLLIDHQGMQCAGVQNIDGTLLINNVVGLTKTEKVFGVPTVLTAVLEERGGFILKGLQDVFPDQKPINRTTVNTLGRQAGRRRDQKRDHFLWMGSQASEPDANEACGLTSCLRRRLRTGTGNGTNSARPVEKLCSCGNRRVKRRSLAKGWKQT
jgi:hypothetical protein